MRKMPFVLGLTAVALAGCAQKPTTQAAQPVTQSQAQAVVSDFGKAVQSMDLAAIDRWYADDVVGYDPGAPDRIDGKISMHVTNARFVDMKFDHAEMPTPKIQILGPDLFIASGLSHLTGSAGKVKKADIRYTEVFRKQSDGTWQTVHEHLDFAHKP